MKEICKCQMECKCEIFVENSHYFTSITTIINTEVVAKLSVTAFVTQLAEQCTRLAWSLVRFSAEGPGVALFCHWFGWVIKCKILTLENFLHQIYTYFLSVTWFQLCHSGLLAF